MPGPPTRGKKVLSWFFFPDATLQEDFACIMWDRDHRAYDEERCGEMVQQGFWDMLFQASAAHPESDDTEPRQNFDIKYEFALLYFRPQRASLWSPDVDFASLQSGDKIDVDLLRQPRALPRRPPSTTFKRIHLNFLRPEEASSLQAVEDMKSYMVSFRLFSDAATSAEEIEKLPQMMTEYYPQLDGRAGDLTSDHLTLCRYPDRTPGNILLERTELWHTGPANTFLLRLPDDHAHLWSNFKDGERFFVFAKVPLPVRPRTAWERTVLG